MKFTKFISLFLALVMCLSIAMPVFAIADTKSISVKLAENEVVPKSTVAPTEGPVLSRAAERLPMVWSIR